MVPETSDTREQRLANLLARLQEHSRRNKQERLERNERCVQQADHILWEANGGRP